MPWKQRLRVDAAAVHRGGITRVTYLTNAAATGRSIAERGFGPERFRPSFDGRRPGARMDLQQTRRGWRYRLGHELDRCLTPGRGRSRRVVGFAGTSLCIAALGFGFPGVAHAGQQAPARHRHPLTVALAPPLPPPAAPSPATPAPAAPSPAAPAPAVEPPEVASGAPPVPAGIAGTGSDAGGGVGVGVAVAQQAPPGDLSTPAGAEAGVGAAGASFALPGTGPQHLVLLMWSALAAVSVGAALVVARRRPPA